MNKKEAFIMGALAARQDVRTRTEYVDRDVNVTINRAPTDESVELLKEMEEAARAKIIASIPIRDNGLEAHLVVFSEDYAGIFSAVLKATANGRPIEVRTSLHWVDGDNLLERLMEDVSKKLMAELIRPAFDSLDFDVKKMLTRNRL